MQGRPAPLYWAIYNKKSPAAIAALLEAGANPNAREKIYGSLLKMALSRESNPATGPIVAALLKAGANPNARDKYGNTPLDRAVRNKNPAAGLIVAALLKAGADPKAGDKHGKGLLYGAVQNNSPAAWPIVAALLKAGADPKARDKYGNTPLNRAVWNSSPAAAPIVAALIKAGANPNARDKYGNTLLHRVAERGKNPAVVAALIEGGADPSAGDKYGKTPLHRAVKNNKNPAVIAALIEGGADPNARDKDGRTLLHRVAGWGKDPAVVAALIKGGADPNAWDERGSTPLHDAARNNKNPAVITEIIKAGADISAWNERGQTPLDLAIAKKNPDVAAALRTAAKCRDWKAKAIFPASGGAADCLNLGIVNPGARDEDGKTLLHHAALRAPPEAGADPKGRNRLAALLEAGFDPNARDKGGRTPLHWAARNNSPAVVAALLEAGADPGARDRKGATPLGWALAGKNRTVVAALAKVTPMDLALLGRLAGLMPERERRERVIALVRRMRRPPPTPKAVRDHMARGAAFVRAARDVKSREGFERAAREFRAAARLAPWLAPVHYNLGVVLESAGRLTEAQESFRAYLLAAPKARDADKVKARVYGLDARVKLIEERRRKKFAGLEGLWCRMVNGKCRDTKTDRFYQLQIKEDGSGFTAERHYRSNTRNFDEILGARLMDERRFEGTFKTYSGRSRPPDYKSHGVKGEVRPGGTRILFSYVSGDSVVQVELRKAH